MKQSELLLMIESEVARSMKLRGLLKLTEGASEQEVSSIIDGAATKSAPFKTVYDVVVGPDNSIGYEMWKESDLPISAGQFELQMEKYGYVLTPEDIKSTYMVGKWSDVQVLEFLTNIFYNNTGGLTKLVPVTTMKWLSDYVMSSGIADKNPYHITVDMKASKRTDCGELYDYLKSKMEY